MAAPMAPRTFDVTPDGRIIRVIETGANASAASRRPKSGLPAQINLAENWVEELTERLRPR
ncbi:MAG TPA: hypothetical protein VF178_02560 [Gemmatimonadaceae bacterium]